MSDEIKTVGVAGSGTMGAGIAIVAARAGFKTVVYDTRTEALSHARKQSELALALDRVDLDRGQLTSTMPAPAPVGPRAGVAR